MKKEVFSRTVKLFYRVCCNFVGNILFGIAVQAVSIFLKFRELHELYDIFIPNNILYSMETRHRIIVITEENIGIYMLVFIFFNNTRAQVTISEFWLQDGATAYTAIQTID